MLKRKIKLDAKSALSRHWGKAICIMMIMLAVGVFFALFESIISVAMGLQSFRQMLLLEGVSSQAISLTHLILSGAMFLLSILVLFPLFTGVFQWYYAVSGGESPEISTIFCMFTSAKVYCKNLWLHLNVGFRTLCWTILLTAPGGWILYWGLDTVRRAESNTGKALAITGLLSGVVLLAVGMIALLMTLQKYLLAFFLFAENPEIKVREAVRLSRIYSWGHRVSLFEFFFSFLPWYLLCIFMLPILYVIPYLGCSTAIYARYLIELGRNQEMEATRAYETPVRTQGPVVDVSDYNEEMKPSSTD